MRLVAAPASRSVDRSADSAGRAAETQRMAANALRTWSTKASGCSKAAK